MEDLIIIIGLILLNGVFSMSEVALISARKTRLASDAKKGSRGAMAALKLAEDPDRFLSTVQIGITLIGILTGLFSGAALSGEFASWLVASGMRAATASAVARTVIVIVVTYLSIVLGELLPKRIGLYSSDRVARLVARPMKILSLITMPAVWLLSKSTAVLVRVFNVGQNGDKVTEEEIKSVIREGASSGEVKDMEQDIMFRALVMGDEKVCSIMTPRTELISLDLGMAPSEVKETIRRSTHSCYPVYNASRDDIAGIVHLKDLVFEICGSDFSLEKVISKACYMPESMQVYDALSFLRKKNVHCGLICDEFGALQGMITLCDILGGLVGSVEVGTDDPFILERQQGDGWTVDGQCPIYDFMTFFDPDSHYQPGSYSTVAGLVLETLKFIPQPGDFILYGDLRIEVVEMDGARIDRLLVTRIN